MVSSMTPDPGLPSTVIKEIASNCVGTCKSTRVSKSSAVHGTSMGHRDEIEGTKEGIN